ncbi:hypothetical protein ACFO1B_49615 [Dactylosporangium siamense]|uniref:Uncharacterized protein n=1 Tax=Dactylosporangium siamense TaxID=685454 RepID=A0A919UHX7_9ACTN|nr:hypothetical protein [Dactylosporangium siamense]GIG52015.1 hypothetical protein Dsi01nite_100560 [Dactylosporangium siamense]
MAAIYPVARAVEHAAGLAGVQPLRVFAVLWPLWQVEITARVEDPAEYELLDSFVTRAVGQAGLDTAAAVAGFLGLGERTVRGCVQYLMTVGHLTADGERLELTPRGLRSMHDGRRYESKEVRQQLLFDRYTAGPFPRSHYANAVTVLDRPEPSLDGVRGSRFTALFASTAFRPEIVDALVRRPDRTGYNVPAEIDRPRVDGVRDAWLPAYLVRTGQGLLAYTAASDGRDAFVEGLCRQAPEVTSALPDTPPEDAERRWEAWLRKEHGGGTLRRQPNGVWRGTLPASAFAAGNRRLASYVVHDELFLQLWCDDRALRRTAMRDRALRIAQSRDVDSRAALDRRLGDLGRQYEVEPSTVDDLRAHAGRTGQEDLLARLEALPATS